MGQQPRADPEVGSGGRIVFRIFHPYLKYLNSPQKSEHFENRHVWGGGGGGTRPWYSVVCLWRRLLAFSPLLILTLCGSERVLVVPTEPVDDLSCLTTPGSAFQRQAVVRAIDQVHPDAHSESIFPFSHFPIFPHLCQKICHSPPLAPSVTPHLSLSDR